MKKTIFCFLAILALPLPAQAEAGDWLVRLRGISVIPTDDSGLISLHAGGTQTPLSGSGVGVNNAVVPELDITYMLHKHWGVEVIAGIANHDVSLQGPGPVLSGLGLTDGFGLFDTWVLPPTVTLQYHFTPDSRFRPYIGAGANYTAFLWDDATDSLEAAIGPVEVNTRNGWGWALQAGMDIDINEKWYFNVDVKYIDVDTTASLHTDLGSLFVDVKVDPVVVGAGIGFRF